MVESLTTNYGWTKPEVTKSASTWGGFLNTDLDSIDALVFANQQGIVPIGGIQMFGGAAAPANWLLCDGTAYSTAAPYDKLFAVLSTRFGGSGGSFNVPNLTQKFPLGAGPNPVGTAGGGFSVPIATANLPAHNHPASQDAHNHAITTGTHAHVITTGGHSHTIATGGHSHGNVLKKSAATGGVPAGIGFSGDEVGTSVGDLGGSASFVGNLGGNTDTAGNLGGSTDGRQPNVYTGNTGSGTPLSVVPPFVAVYFIIRYV